MTDVVVLIPARNAAASLERACVSAQSQTPGPMDVVVAVGPSDDHTPAVAAALASTLGVRIVENPSGTTPSGLNRALESSSASIVVRVDAHAVLPQGYVDLATQVLEGDATIGNVGGRQVPTADDGFAAAVAAAMTSPAGAGGAAYRTGTEAGPVDTVYLGVFRREALEEVGGFDERMVRNQDYELNLRLRKAGWNVWFDPRLEVEYRPRDSVRSLARQYFDYGRYRRLTARLHPGTLRLRQLAAPVMVLGFLLAALSSLVLPWILPAVTASYLLAVLVAGFAAERRRGVLVAVALTVMHWAWGIGFLLGPPRDVSREQSSRR